jgi:propionyl-CoA carboxylase alpha chain
MQHPRFRSGELTTGFIAEEYPEGFHGAATSDALKRTLAGLAGFLATARADRSRQIDGQLGDELDPPSSWAVKIAGETHAVEVGGDTITVDGAEIDLALEYTPGDRLIHAEADGEALIVKVEAKASPAPDHARRDPRCPGPARAHRASGAAHDRKGAAGYVQVPVCPMPGLLVALNVGEGDAVEAGPLAVVEAMKMENILRAEKAGKVKAVNAKAGDSLAVDAIILELE